MSQALRRKSSFIEDLLVKFCDMLCFPYWTRCGMDTARNTFSESFLASEFSSNIVRMYVIQQRIESKQLEKKMGSLIRILYY